MRDARYTTREAAIVDLLDYTEVSCNRSRRHSTHGYVSPPWFLAGWLSNQHQQAAAAWPRSLGNRETERSSCRIESEAYYCKLIVFILQESKIHLNFAGA